MHEAEAGSARAWVLLPRDLVPQRWMDRSADVVLVPLLPEEAAKLLSGQPVEPEVDSEGERLLALLGRGLSITAIARELGVSERTVEYRLRRLREQLQVTTTAELVALVAERGFGGLRKGEAPLRREKD